MARKINRKLAKLFDQKQQNLFCDIMLVAAADGTGIRAHRCVLHAASKYFEAMLTADMKESSLDTITLNGVSSAVLAQLIDYAYTEEIDIDASNVNDILAAADLFLFDDVVAICESIYAAAIDATNVLQILAIAEKYRLMDLQVNARTFAYDNFLEIIDSVAFLGLEAGTVFRLLESDDIQIDSEKDVFNAIVRWIEANSEERKWHYAALMQTVRMSKINSSFLNGRILDWSKQIGMNDVFITACNTKYQQQMELTDAERKPRFKYMFAAGFEEHDESTHIERYSVTSNTWESITTFAGRGSWQIHCIDDCLYMFEFRSDHGNQVKRIPLDTMEVEDRKSMQNARSCFASVTVGQYVYCIGGCNSENVFTRSAVRYDTRNDEWIDIGMLIETHCFADAVVLEGKIYVVGGQERQFDNYSRSVERYDPATNRWTKVADLNVARSDHRCCAIKGYIYAVGGLDDEVQIASIEKYDAQLDRWTIIQYELDGPRDGFGISAHGNWIYIAGGRTNDEFEEHSDGFLRMNVSDGRIETLSSMNNEVKEVFIAVTL